MTILWLVAVAGPIVMAAMFFAIAVELSHRRRRARLTDLGYQEMSILVRGRYSPDVVYVRRGIPLRLHFRREENVACSEQVVFSELRQGYRLPAYQTTSVCFIPTRQGESLFTCGLGMYQGRLVVVEPTKAEMRKVLAIQMQSTVERAADPRTGNPGHGSPAAKPEMRGRGTTDA